MAGAASGKEANRKSAERNSGQRRATGKQLLTADDFRYLGRVAVVGMGWSTQGLAYRPETETFFTVEKSGKDPYGLHEFSLPAPTLPPEPAPRVTPVKSWGPLNQEKRLAVKGELVSLRGLWWDAEEKRLWFNFGSFYASGANNPVLGCATLSDDGLKVYGPWKVSDAVHADTVKGMLFPAPPSLRKITGQRLLAFGVRGSTAQGQSWGAGLVSLEPPSTSLPAGREIAASRLIHWPMKQEGGVAFSNFPRVPGDEAVFIAGNGNAGRRITGTARGGGPKSMKLEEKVNFPPGGNATLVGCYLTNVDTEEQIRIVAWDNATKVATVASEWKQGAPTKETRYEVYFPSYERNQFVPVGGRYCNADALTSATWIDLPNKEGLLYFGATALGYVWYGNPRAHNDTTPTGKKYANALKSLLHSDQELKSDFDDRGVHAELHVPRWYLVDPKRVRGVAAKVFRGGATAGDLQIPWTSAGDVTKLGGDVVLASPRFCQMHWDRPTRRLSVLTLAGGDNTTAEIHVWEVGQPETKEEAEADDEP
jgi:hypothetical protein